MNSGISDSSNSTSSGQVSDPRGDAQAFTVAPGISAEMGKEAGKEAENEGSTATQTLHLGAETNAEINAETDAEKAASGKKARAAPSPKASGSTLVSAWRSPWFFIALLALGLAAWQWVETRAQLAETRQELARRLGENDLARRGNEHETKKAQEEVTALKAKLAAIEEKFAESKSQQATLELLYQQLAKGREEWAFAEVEQGLNLAAQQLQLAGNVQAAVLALQTADARLTNNNQPQFIALRKAINRDLGRLQALPAVDLPGTSMRLERLLGNVDVLPLAVYARPNAAPAGTAGDVSKAASQVIPKATPRTAPKAASKTAPKAGDAPVQRGGETGKAPAAGTPPDVAAPEAESPGFWGRLGGELWSELKGMVRIQRFDRAEPPLLAPGQEFFLRENLKLRLLNARLALLMRDQSTYRGEIAAAQDWIKRYFDTREAPVETALSSLQQLGAAEINITLPTLNDSLSALRNAKLVGAQQ